MSGTLRMLKLAEKVDTVWEPKAAHTWPSLKNKRRKTQKYAIKVFLEDAHIYEMFISSRTMLRNCVSIIDIAKRFFSKCRQSNSMYVF